MRSRESITEEMIMLRNELRYKDEQLAKQRHELMERCRLEIEALRKHNEYLTKLILDAVNCCPLHHMHSPLIMEAMDIKQ